MQTQDYIDLENQLGAHNYKPLDVVLERGEGVWVWDVEGNRYMDCLAAYSAVNQGHCHPRIVAALTEQAKKLTLASRAFRTDQLSLFYKKVREITGMARCLPMNTGAEAVETAIKAARKWGYEKKGIASDQAEILVFTENFHGRTTTIVGFSSEEGYKHNFGPFTPGFTILPYGDLDAVKQRLESHGKNIAGVLIEPIQGEAGIIVPPDGYLKGLRDLCTEHKCLLMMDEIQSGLGRTGKMFAYEHEEACPDVLILGKALSGGAYPVSAMLASEEVMSVFAPGQHGSTYGGNPLGAAVAREALAILVEEKLVENSAELGRYAIERLQGVASEHIEQVRGRGLWIGIVLKPEAGGARRFCEALMREGLLCKETHEHVIRVAPPLCINRDDLDWALDALERVLTATVPA